MSKRFTDTEKWRNRWFFSLKPEFKLAWIWLIDNCDLAGVIELIPEVANNEIGIDIDWGVFKSKANERQDEPRIFELRDGRWWISPFVERQYPGGLGSSKFHEAVKDKLTAHGLTGYAIDMGLIKSEGSPNPSGTLPEPSVNPSGTLRDPSETLSEGSVNLQGKGKGKGKGKGEGRKEKAPTDFDRFWEVVHQKKAVQAAKKAWPQAIRLVKVERSCAEQEAADYIIEAMREFASSPEADPDDHTPIHPSTWLNQGRYNDDRSTWHPSKSKVKTSDELDKLFPESWADEK